MNPLVLFWQILLALLLPRSSGSALGQGGRKYGIRALKLPKQLCRLRPCSAFPSLLHLCKLPEAIGAGVLARRGGAGNTYQLDLISDLSGLMSRAFKHVSPQKD